MITLIVLRDFKSGYSLFMIRNPTPRLSLIVPNDQLNTPLRDIFIFCNRGHKRERDRWTANDFHSPDIREKKKGYFESHALL